MTKPVIVECTFTYIYYNLNYDPHDYHDPNLVENGTMTQVLEFPSMAHFLAIKKDPLKVDASFFINKIHEMSLDKILDYSFLTRRTIHDRPVYKVVWTRLLEL